MYRLVAVAVIIAVMGLTGCTVFETDKRDPFTAEEALDPAPVEEPMPEPAYENEDVDLGDLFEQGMKAKEQIETKAASDEAAFFFKNTCPDHDDECWLCHDIDFALLHGGYGDECWLCHDEWLKPKGQAPHVVQCRRKCIFKKNCNLCHFTLGNQVEPTQHICCWNPNCAECHDLAATVGSTPPDDWDCTACHPAGGFANVHGGNTEYDPDIGRCPKCHKFTTSITFTLQEHPTEEDEELEYKRLPNPRRKNLWVPRIPKVSPACARAGEPCLDCHIIDKPVFGPVANVEKCCIFDPKYGPTKMHVDCKGCHIPAWSSYDKKEAAAPTQPEHFNVMNVCGGYPCFNLGCPDYVSPAWGMHGGTGRYVEQEPAQLVSSSCDPHAPVPACVGCHYAYQRHISCKIDSVCVENKPMFNGVDNCTLPSDHPDYYYWIHGYPASTKVFPNR